MPPQALSRRQFLQVLSVTVAGTLVDPRLIPTPQSERLETQSWFSGKIEGDQYLVNGTPVDLSLFREGGHLNGATVDGYIREGDGTTPPRIGINSQRKEFGHPIRPDYRTYLAGLGVTLFQEIAPQQKSGNILDVLSTPIRWGKDSPSERNSANSELLEYVSSHYDLRTVTPIDQTKPIELNIVPQKAPEIDPEILGRSYYDIEDRGYNDNPNFSRVSLEVTGDSFVLGYNYPRNYFINLDEATYEGPKVSVESSTSIIEQHDDGSASIRLLCRHNLDGLEAPLRDEAILNINPDGSIDFSTGGHNISIEPFDSGMLSWSFYDDIRYKQAKQILMRALLLTQISTKNGLFVRPHHVVSTTIARALAKHIQPA